MRVITLPPSSPELNPSERIWDVIKDRICNRAWEDLEELTAVMNGILAEYWSTPHQVRSLIGDGWLLDTANASSQNVLAA